MGAVSDALQEGVLSSPVKKASSFEYKFQRLFPVALGSSDWEGHPIINALFSQFHFSSVSAGDWHASHVSIQEFFIDRRGVKPLNQL